jgi:hypothetical protein
MERGGDSVGIVVRTMMDLPLAIVLPYVTSVVYSYLRYMCEYMYSPVTVELELYYNNYRL